MGYYVLGPGGAKLGPVTIATMRAMVGDGRITAETLVEDAGSGVKAPARAIRGLAFAPTAPGQSSPDRASTYVRPGQGTAGSQADLFLPSQAQSQIQDSTRNSQDLFLPGDVRLRPVRSSSSLFLSGAESKWMWHGLASAGIAVGCALVVAFLPFFFDRMVWVALGIPIYGAMCGYRGLRSQPARGLAIILLNALAIAFAAAALVYRSGYL